MNNGITYVAQKNKTMAHRTSLNNMIYCVVEIFIFGFKTYWKSFQFYGDTNNTNLQTFLASLNTQHREKQVILVTIRCKMTESLSQAGNDETTN